MIANLFRDSVVGFFTIAGIILAITLVLGRVADRLRLPRVVVEMLAGLLLSKVLLGAVIGEQAWETVFQPDTMLLIKGFGLFGVGAYMFQMGEHLDLQVFKSRNGIPVVGIGMVVVPFVLGLALGDILYVSWGKDVSRLVFDLFIGLAIAATAFPVLCRIMQHIGLLDTEIGKTTVAVASINDILVYVMLAVVTALAATVGTSHPFWAFLGSIAYIALMLVVVKPVLGRLLHKWDLHNGEQLATLCAMLLFSFALAELAGVHVIFGGFLMGAIIPRDVLNDITEKVMEKFVRVFLMPLFFAYSGIRIHGVAFTPELLWVTLFVVIGACVAKIVPGIWLARRALHYSWPRAFTFGVLMNTRGTVELVLLNIGLDAGILSPALFGVMVTMTIVTTALTGPVSSWFIGEYREEFRRLPRSER